jgi:beta-glucanase (GH16 family)
MVTVTTSKPPPACARATRRLGFLAAGAALVLVMFGGSSRPAYGDWTNVWSDEFNGTNVDLTKWVFDIGTGPPYPGWGNSELEYYTSRTNNAFVTNGVLHIVARQESYTNSSYTSARLKTQGIFAKKYGRFEFRAKLPHGQGYWPALWLMPRDSVYGGWARSGEIDVMENKGSSYSQIAGTAIFGGSWPDQVYDSTTYTVPNTVTNFHVYALEWTTNRLIWSVDDVAYKTNNGSWWSDGGSYPAPFDQYFYILVNLAVGGNYGGDPDGSTVFPGEMQVDYVRVYDPVVATTPPSTPTGLTATAGGAQVALNWSNSPSATSYKVKRATVSGGSYTTIANPTANSYTDTGVASCATYYYVVSATNSLGESANSSEASATLGSYALAVNSGGSAASPFIADAYVTGGTAAAPTAAAINTTGVTNPAPQAVYQTERYGTFTYTFGSLTTGTAYTVRLHLAEYYFTAANQRKFNVTINGTQVLTNYDIFAAAGGQNKAVVREFMVTPNVSGQIVILFSLGAGSVDQPKSSGIEILAPPPVSPTGLAATPSDAQVVLNWNTSPGAQSYNVKRATTGGGPYTAITNALVSTTYTDVSVVNGTNYYYVVTAIRAGCESASSAEASATPLSQFMQWQMLHFGCTACSEANAAADPDGDGQNNLAEYIAGTDPENIASSFRITAIVGEGNDLRVIWTMGSSKTNALQATSGDPDGSYSTNFADIFTVTNTLGSVTNYLDVGAVTNDAPRYYRIRIVP